MRGHLAFAEGSPCPTLVLPAADLPDDDEGLVAALGPVRDRLQARGHGNVLKIATVAPSTTDSHDLDYRFVQVVPDATGPRFDLGGSCGHSLLCTVAVAAGAGWIPPLRPGRVVRARVRNNDDVVACDVDSAGPGRVTFTVRFVPPGPLPVGDLLLFDEPVSVLAGGGTVVRASVVSHGNPYVFVDAADLGCDDADALFGADHLIGVLREIRAVAERLLGWRPGVFPKIAAVCPAPDGAVAVRSISVPSWHPTLALTGAVCLAAAAGIPGTVPAAAGRLDAGRLQVRTAAGPATVRAVVDDGLLHEVGVTPKTVHTLGTVPLPDPVPHHTGVPAREGAVR